VAVPGAVSCCCCFCCAGPANPLLHACPARTCNEDEEGQAGCVVRQGAQEEDQHDRCCVAKHGTHCQEGVQTLCAGKCRSNAWAGGTRSAHKLQDCVASDAAAALPWLICSK
jgi:hypothetical protein